MSKNRTSEAKGSRLRRLLSGVLCMALALSLLPGLELTAQAAAKQSWAMPYAQQLVDWGVMRGDISGNLNLDRAVTRAEFVTFINRAYGYTKLGGTPFTDVSPLAWYAQDIDIAYNVGYFKGVGPTTAAPLSPVTREQAAVFLARNLMLQETVGETLGFSDTRTLSEWSRGLIGAAAASGVINGYSDGSFRPQQNITRGEVAAMLVRSIGTPINKAGDYSLGSVYGNVTINTSGVNLRNSVITGNLYLTGGVDLGDVLLENVKVLGQIIVSGAGESNSSQSSVLLRNVEADEMIVDSIGNQFVTIRAEGNTAIGKTFVRTNAYVDDSSLNGFGLSYIELDAENGGLLQLAGNVKEVLNKTPGSSLQIVQGSAQKVTVDEDAVGSNVLVDTNTRVDELDLDVATNVTGSGDIKNLNVGAAGSVVEQLPDDIYIRPGINADVNGSEMNNATGAESSAEPKLEAGFPKVKDVAPTSATMAFSTNKAGTVYWAVSAVADGSVSEENLISPPSYGGNIFKSGTVKADVSKTEYTAQVSGLTTDGSYYVSAILVDSRGNRSPVKVTAFTTPDNTTPAFTTGYPIITMNTTDNVQVTAMTNKDCLLYWALLPTGSTAPKPAEFKANAISGNLGYGSVDMVKNVTQPINVNRNKLEELTKYDLYLWLTDHDGAKSSTVRKITFTTPDETPPVITGLEQNLQRTTATAVGVNYSLNEPGTLHWVIYADNATNAFATEFGRNEDDEKWAGEDVRAKAFVKAGLNSIKKGSSSASKADTDIAFAISGLNSKTTNTTSYMLYVVAEDKAGNLSVSVKALNVQTLDTVPPTVKQEFTKVDADNPNEPEVNTDIRLVFDENVQGDPNKSERFLELYSKVARPDGESDAEKEANRELARIALAEALENHITMYRRDARGGEEKAPVRSPANPNPANDDWVVDYRYATVTMENGNMVITLPTTSNKTTSNVTEGSVTIPPSALNLQSGGTYWFVLSGIYDMALTPNIMNKDDKGKPEILPEFRIVFANVSITGSDSISIKQVNGAPVDPISIDFKFIVRPNSVEAVTPNILWDMLIWVNRSMKYDLYSRPARPDGVVDDGKDWVLEGSAAVDVYGSDDGFIYSSFRKEFQCKNEDLTFKQLSQMGLSVTNTPDGVKKDPGHGEREYAIHIKELGASYGDAQGMSVRVSIVSGNYTGLDNVSKGNRLTHLETAKKDNGVVTIGRPDPWTSAIPNPYPPKLESNYPVISKVTDTSATVTVMLNEAGYVNYVAVPLEVTGTDTGFDSSKELQGQEKYVTKYTAEVPPTAFGLGKNWSTPEGRPATTGTIVLSLTGLPNLEQVPDQGPAATTLPNDSKVITNDHRYYLSEPKAERVVAMAESEDSGQFDTIRSGRTGLMGANRTTSFTLEGLEPDTIYLLYLVTENTSNYPEVNAECYRFTTAVVQPPKLEVSGIHNPTIETYVEAGTTAYMRWYVITKASVGVPFTTDFASIADMDKLNNSADKSKYTTGMTALDAMNERCYRTTTEGNVFAGTLFDLYVKKENIAPFAAAILDNSSQIGGDIVGGSGKNPVRINSSGYQVKCGDLPTFEGGKDYVFVAMAGRTPEDTNYSFAVYDPVKKKDAEPPKIEAAYINETYDASGTNTSWGPGGNTAENPVLTSATLTLDFDEELYHWVKKGEEVGVPEGAHPIDNCQSHAPNPKVHTDANGKKTYVYAIGKAGGTTGLSIKGDNSSDGTSPIRSINFNISNLSPGVGYTSTLRYRFVDAAGNGTERAALRINVKLVDRGTNGNHSWAPEVTINNVRDGDSVWTTGSWNYTL